MNLIGLFLITMGLAMLGMGVIYKKTKNLNLSWIFFGIIYIFGIFGVLKNSSLMAMFHVSNNKSVISLFSLLILGIGIMISYIFFGKNERKLILSILLVVGIHLIPLKNLIAFFIFIMISINALIGFWKKNKDVTFFIFSDSFIKICSGIILLFL